MVSATSSNPALIPNPAISYTSANATGSLSFTPVFGASGTATITVTVMDSGGSGLSLNGSHNINTVNESFTVTVTPINAPPQLNPISGPGTILENAGAQTVFLSGINGGASASQILTVTAVSNNPGLIPNPSVTYNNPDTTGYITFTPATNVSGVATITVTVMDNGGTLNGGVNTVSQAFTVNVTQVNQAPTLDPLKNPPALALNTTSQQTVALTGISAGPGDSGQTLTVSATSDNTSLILDPIINATATAVLGSGTTAGMVSTFTITNGGSGYAFPPAVTLLGGGSGPGFMAATATAVLTNGVVTQIMVNAGVGNAGYTSAPLVSIAPPVSTAVATAQIGPDGSGNLTVTGFTITNGGSGYLSPPVVTLTGGGFATNPPVLTAVLNNAGVVTAITASGGSGYSSPPQVSIASPGTGAGALVVNYTSGNPTGSITYTPVLGASGTANISVTVTDNGTARRHGVRATRSTSPVQR